MQNTSDTWKSLAATDGVQVETKAIVNGVEYSDIEPPIITRALMQNGLEIGNVVSAMCSLTLDTDSIIPKSASVVIKARLVGGSDEEPVYSEWLPQGTFYLSKRVRDPNTNIRRFECYDTLLRSNVVWEPASSTWPQETEDILDEILATIGLQLDSRTSIVSYPISEPIPGTTMRDILSIIAQHNGGNWIVTPDNKLRLVPIIDLDGAEEADTIVDVDAVVGSYYIGETKTISGIRFPVDDNTSIVGDETGAIVNVTIPGVIVADLAETLIGKSYRPFSFGTAYYDMAAELGDFIQCEDITSVLYSENITLGTTMHGDIAAPDLAEIDDEFPYVGNTQKTIALAKATVNEAVKQLDNDLTQQEIFNRLTDNGAAQGLVMYDGQLYMNATYINAGELSVRRVNFSNYDPPYKVPNEYDPDSLLRGQTVQDGWIVNQNGYNSIGIISCDNAVPLRGKTLIFTLISRNHITEFGGSITYTDEQGVQWDETIPVKVAPAYGREDAEGNLDGATDNGEYEQYSDSYTVPDYADSFYIEVECSGVKSISVSEPYSGNFGLRYGNNIGLNYKGLQVGKFVVDRSGNATFNGAARFNGDVSSLLERVYPVGSIYMSVNSTDPGTLFGGTWQRLKDRFLLAAGDSYAAGATGGEASHTLTAAESGVPAHAHGLNSHKHSVGAHSHGLNSHKHSVGAHSHGLNSHTHGVGSYGMNDNGGHTHNGYYLLMGNTQGAPAYPSTDYNTAPNNKSGGAVTQSAGTHKHTITGTSGAASGNTANSSAFDTGAASGNTANSAAFDTGAASGNTANNTAANASSAHNNMPPYLAVYMWKRTA